MGLQHNIDPAEIENLVWAFRYLANLDYVDPDRVGMGGFCVGASFALVAAADPRISSSVSFVNAFGPYYDARDVLLQMGSRTSFLEEGNIPWEPDQLTLRVFANELIETLDHPADRQTLAAHYLQASSVSQDELNALSQPAARIHRLLQGTTLEDAQTIYHALPPGFRAEMDRISPIASLENVRANLAIMHDRNDRLIPVGESRRLHRAASRLPHPAASPRLHRPASPRPNLRYTEFDSFDHVRPAAGNLWNTAIQGIKLYRHVYNIIKQAR